MKFVCDKCQAQYSISDEKVGPNGVAVKCKKCTNRIIVKRAAPVEEPAESTVVMQIPAGMMESQPSAGGGVSAAPASSPIAQSTTSPTMPAIPAAKAAPAGGELPFAGGGIEDDIGKAFDSVLGGLGGDELTKTNGNEAFPNAPTNGHANPFAALGGPGGDEEGNRESTRVMDLGGLASQLKVPEEPKSDKKDDKPALDAAPANDWFVAINDNQVGPLTVDGVKERWNKGELSADSLVWRTGMGDWKPLSQVPELSHLIVPVPKPQMPVQDDRREPPAGATATGAQAPSPSVAPPQQQSDVPEWKPSAAMALESLVKEELEALKRPAPKAPPAKEKDEPAPESKAKGGLGLLDLPDEVSEPSAPAPKAALETADFVTEKKPLPDKLPERRPPVLEEARAPLDDEPAQEPLPKPRRRPVEHPTGEAPRTLHAVAPPETVPPPKSRTGLYVGGAILAAIVILGLGAMVLLRPQPVIVQQVPVPVAPVAAVAQPVAPAPVAAAPTPAPAQPVAAAPVQPAPAPVAAAPEPKAEEKKAEPVAEAKAEPKAAEPKAEEKKAEAPPAAEPVRKQPQHHQQVAMVERPQPKVKEPKAEPPPQPAHEDPPTPPPSGKSKVDADFDAIFGGGGGSEPQAAAKPEKKKSTYIPPPPAGAKAQLSQSDIMEVVLANKGAIKNCVDQMKAADPSASGTIVMRWIIKPDGGTANIQTMTKEFQKTAISSCMASMIRGWKFSAYSGAQMPPIDFPFKF